ncbi:DivIVA domain-containing protein [Enterococcus gilvus]|uniref:DivIVA domain-containing protein n=1 Tax=Enterococcus TaxID=1350 RepID=UPI00290A4ABD|nr:DivIVA domain-containing protein [Enterococcus gilvus]MDU5512075.1 DivIVA domain-containing protein [Enterococcus gilvus]
MKFSIDGLKNLTFPSGAMGYKKKDVDDFLSYVAKDYGSYQRQLEKSKTDNEELQQEKDELLKKLDEQKDAHEATLEKFRQENQALKTQINTFQTTSVSNNLNEDTALSLSQKVALRIEKQAKEEAAVIKTNADEYYAQQLKKMEAKRKEIESEVVTSLSELIGSERMIVASIDTVKQEYVRLMSVIRENYETMTDEAND